MNLLAFDIGGTQIKYGLIDQAGEVLHAETVSTQAGQGGAALLERLVMLARPWVEKACPAGIALSTLGLVEPAHGTILAAAEAVPGYIGCSPKAALQQAFGLPVTVENDVNCVALAEGWRGAAQGASHYIAVAVGTGIGGGIVINGRLYRGHRAAAGEWGYMRINGKLWEDHASMRGLVHAAQAATGRIGLDGRAIFAAYDAGDPAFTRLVADWLTLLATGIVNLIYAFNPERVVIGGGIAGRGERFLAELNASIDGILLPDFHGMSRIVLASAGNHAGMIGAARNWLTEQLG
ncbi:ROK family protein [Chitiniphilus purpureus]|uniref:ROK family protein n=1 Tax=Chitiniphilus purpureus TaxID=2981137 RepID=A0ABY6DIW7_9NEIS|nr:ROK family protein [Chitiniphilus sp. CD1]UXY14296.1 ROK family protein [Chitiniphilus sp. CD1]